MIVSEKVRAVRKTAQKDRLKEKAKAKKNGYAEYYANMPQQLVKAKAQQQIHADRQEVKDTLEAVQISEITGEGLLNAQEKYTVAKLVLEKHEAAERPNPQIVLTAVGGL